MTDEEREIMVSFDEIAKKYLEEEEIRSKGIDIGNYKIIEQCIIPTTEFVAYHFYITDKDLPIYTVFNHPYDNLVSEINVGVYCADFSKTKEYIFKDMNKSEIRYHYENNEMFLKRLKMFDDGKLPRYGFFVRQDMFDSTTKELFLSRVKMYIVTDFNMVHPVPDELFKNETFKCECETIILSNLLKEIVNFKKPNIQL